MSHHFVFAQGSEWSVGVKRAGMGTAFQAEGKVGTPWRLSIMFIFFSDFPIWAVP